MAGIDSRAMVHSGTAGAVCAVGGLIHTAPGTAFGRGNPRGNRSG